MTLVGRISIQSSTFPNVFLRMDGSRVTEPTESGEGTVNCQFGSGLYTQFIVEPQANGEIAFASVAFPGVYLRMDGKGVTETTKRGGTVNCQSFAGPYERFTIEPQADGTVAIASIAFPGVYLCIDGQDITEATKAGGGTVNCQFGLGSYTQCQLSNLDAREENMENLFEEFLRGTLKSFENGEKLQSVKFDNQTQLLLTAAWINKEGKLIGSDQKIVRLKIEPGKSASLVANGAFYPKNSLFVIFTFFSGAFVGIVEAKEEILITDALIRSPNNIGPYPLPTKSVPIPNNSPRILVGYGKTQSGNLITREQFWQRAGDSYVLAPGQTKTVSYTMTSGIQQTSSEQTTIAASLGMNVAAGWGAISTSLSASLNQQSTAFQQISTQTESTYFESLELKNDSNETRMFLKWALNDVITIFDQKNPSIPIASVVNIENPVLIGGPYNPDNLAN